MLISELLTQPDGPITGTFRVTTPRQRVSRSGTPYLMVDLADCSGIVRAHGWPERYCGLAQPADLSVVTVTGTIRKFHDRMMVDLLQLEPASVLADPVMLFPQSCCPIIGGIDRLIGICAEITTESLRNFVDAVLTNDLLALPFLRLPASYRHHHSFPGGLVAHSLECAEIVATLGIDLPRQTRELGVVAALWHDIGKVMTLDDRRGAWLNGAVLDHDALTLELLSTALAGLDREWVEGAMMLRYLFTWKKNGRGGRPLQVIAEAVSAADRISSGLSAERLAFAETEEWKKLEKWNGSQYLRLALP
jgi:3'-5' exoribonuclease